MDFLRFVTRRVISGVVVLSLITVATFALFFIAPPDVARTLRREGGDPATGRGIRRRLGLDQPYSYGLARLDGLLRGCDLRLLVATAGPGELRCSRRTSHHAVLVIGRYNPVADRGIGFGVLSATRARSLLDRLTTTGVLIGYSMPTFVLGGLLLFVRLLPAQQSRHPVVPAGLLPDHAEPDHLARADDPAVDHPRHRSGGGIQPGSPGGSLLDALGEDYIRTARAKGLSERRVVYRPRPAVGAHPCDDPSSAWTSPLSSAAPSSPRPCSTWEARRGSSPGDPCSASAAITASGLLAQALVGDIDAAERRLEIGSEPRRFGDSRAQMKAILDFP